MKVFISWSGDISHKVAICLRDWLPSVIQAVEPYVSSEDIDKGARWSTDISKELETSSYGILCVTGQNIEASWLNFEAGALSKFFDKARVSPFLFGIKRSDVKGPLLQFQSTIFERDDVFKLIKSINNAQAEGKISEERLLKIFEVWWPELEKLLHQLVKEEKKENPSPQPSSKKDAILEEVLELARRQQLLLNSPEKLLPPEYLQQLIIAGRNRVEIDHPVWMDLGRVASHLFRVVNRVPEDKSIDIEFLELIQRDVFELKEMIQFISSRFEIKIPLETSSRRILRRRPIVEEVGEIKEEN